MKWFLVLIHLGEFTIPIQSHDDLTSCLSQWVDIAKKEFVLIENGIQLKFGEYKFSCVNENDLVLNWRL